MKRKVLGLDINEEFVAATVIGQKGQDRVITAFGFERLHDRDDLSQALPLLLEKVNWKEGDCFCGISLSGISLRNLSIPFTENRKIAQILPLELEDQLLTPVRDQLVEYTVSVAEEDHSHLLVAALEKKRMKHDLELLAESWISPQIVTLRTVALAEELQRNSELAEGFLFIDAGLHAANIAIVMQKRVVLVRRLAYPDRVFTARPFIFDEDGPRIANHEEAMECIGSLCDDIKTSMGLYKIDSGIASLPETIVVSGSMAHIPDVLEKIGIEFEREVRIGNLLQSTSVSSGLVDEGEWIPGLYDHSLALLLQGSRKKITFNFRKDEFAPPKLYFTSKNQLFAAAAILVFVLAGLFTYMGFDYRTLNTRYHDLGKRMENLFKETFPETTRIVDPLVQMKTNLRNVQAPSIATPIFSGDKRTLNILADISGRVPDSVEIHVVRMVVDKDSVTLKGTTDTFNNVNLIQGVLRKSPVFKDVDIVSAAAEKESGQIRFELKLQTVGVL